MVQFNQWFEGLIFFLVFSSVIVIPCVFLAVIGRKMAKDLGQYPSKTPEIVLKSFPSVVGLSLMAFAGLFIILLVFSD